MRFLPGGKVPVHPCPKTTEGKDPPSLANRPHVISAFISSGIPSVARSSSSRYCRLSATSTPPAPPPTTVMRSGPPATSRTPPPLLMPRYRLRRASSFATNLWGISQRFQKIGQTRGPLYSPSCIVPSLVNCTAPHACRDRPVNGLHRGRVLLCPWDAAGRWRDADVDGQHIVLQRWTVPEEDAATLRGKRGGRYRHWSRKRMRQPCRQRGGLPGEEDAVILKGKGQVPDRG